MAVQLGVRTRLLRVITYTSDLFGQSQSQSPLLGNLGRGTV